MPALQMPTGTFPGEGAVERKADVPSSTLDFMVQRDRLREHLRGNAKVQARMKESAEDEVSFLSRFIIATNGDVDAAAKQIDQFTDWFEEFNLERIYRLPAKDVLQCKGDPKFIHERYPLYIRGTDRYGHPVLYARACYLNVHQILEQVNETNFIRYHAWLRERMMRMRDLQLRKMGIKDYSPLDAQFTVVMDLENGSTSQLKKPFYSIMKKTMQIDQTFFPERMFRSILINAPFIFSAVWAIVKTFLDKDTVAKLRIVRSDYFKYLEEVIDPSEIPSDYGGKAPPLTYEDHASQVTERFYARLDREEKEEKSQAAAALETSSAPSPPNSTMVASTGSSTRDAVSTPTPPMPPQQLKQ